MTGQTTEKWYYIVVQNPGTPDEEFVGYEDKDTGATFIPSFASKDEATQCFFIMPKDVMKQKYEVQAIIREDLVDHARNHDFRVFLLDHTGTVKEEII